ncbi:MAG: hypothetical protein NT080_13620 [Spirochaetes bacterium]|nr:hypothetical protein [Spirochaetota bacterium]
MNRQRTFCAALLAFACAAVAAAQATTTIRFYDKRVYYTDDPVFVKITILNDSPLPFRFKLAENRVFSLWFEGRTMTNRALERGDSYKRTISSSEAVYYRDILLEPGEEYSFVEDVRSYLAIPGAGAYTIACFFSPELARNSPYQVPLKSNILTLNVRPGLSGTELAETVSAETGEIIKAERIPPDEVVRRSLVARQRNRWNEFFVYLDLESLLQRDPEKKRIYDHESDDGRRRMLDRYRNDLERRVVDSDIVVIPDEFRIIETKYTETIGSVRVLEKFRYDGFTMIKEYGYELRRRDDIWYIVGYTVVNKGTE